MVFTKTLIFSVLVGVCSYLAYNAFTNYSKESINKPDISGASEKRSEILLTKNELSKFTGTDGRPVYVAFLGKIYDVTSGIKHYGPGGGYHFFTGKDASRAFVTGDFSEKGLTDDLLDLKEKEMLVVKNWIEFYEKDYVSIGKLIGRYYDEQGKNKNELFEVWKAIMNAMHWQEENENEKETLPPCNSEWNSKDGGRVWCTTASGGVIRNWKGVPRQYRKPGTNEMRCVCVRNTGPSSYQSSVANSDRGDLDNPNLKVYPNCDEKSESCSISE